MPKARHLPFEAVPPVFDRATAAANGITARQLRGSRIVRVGYGRYADASAATQWHRYAAALAGLPPGSAICDLSALAMWRLPAPWSRREDERVHVCVPAPYAPTHRQGVVVHRRVLRSGDVVRRYGLPVTSLARTFVDIAASIELEELVAIGDRTLATGRCGPQRLAAQLKAAKGQRGLVRAKQALPMLDARAQSPPESVLRVRIVVANLPAPEPQCEVVLSSGQKIHLDLGYREYRVGLEHEGRHHTEAKQFAIDTSRYTELSAEGWLILRSSADDLAGGSHRLLTNLRSALIHRGWTPAEIECAK
jgi:hypothetical protein